MGEGGGGGVGSKNGHTVESLYSGHQSFVKVSLSQELLMQVDSDLVLDLGGSLTAFHLL